MERLGEDLLDARVDLADDGQQVLLRAAQVGELLAEERVPFLQGRVLLEGQRIDLAELLEVAFGRAQPLLLQGPLPLLDLGP